MQSILSSWKILFVIIGCIDDFGLPDLLISVPFIEYYDFNGYAN